MAVWEGLASACGYQAQVADTLGIDLGIIEVTFLKLARQNGADDYQLSLLRTKFDDGLQNGQADGWVRNLCKARTCSNEFIGSVRKMFTCQFLGQ